MSNLINISIIIPFYNAERHIKNCLNTILTQDFNQTFEIIMVDDASTDRAQEEIKKYNVPLLKLLSLKDNTGQAAARNLGIKNAKGKYIVRVDSDDYVNVEFLKILYLFIHLNENIDASACDYYLVNDDEKVIKKVNCDQNPIGCGIMFEAQHLISIGLYNENFLLNEEKELRERFVKKYKITRIPLPLYRYRQHDNNMTKQ